MLDITMSRTCHVNLLRRPSSPVDDLQICHRINAILYMCDVRVIKAPQHMEDAIHSRNM